MAFTAKLSIHWDAGSKFENEQAGKLTIEIKRLVDLGLTTMDVTIVDGEMIHDSALTITREFADVKTATEFMNFVANLATESNKPTPPLMSVISL
jgi:hypothetical protein